jgi:hypothetical protein
VKLGVVFNCQHDGLAQSLRHLLPASTVLTFGSPELAASARIRQRALEELPTCDAIIMADAMARLGPPFVQKLQREARRIATVPPIVFGGFHPDVCFLTLDKRAVLGPTAGLHSRIAIAAFLAGYAPRDAEQLYNRLVFTRLEYAGAFHQQQALLVQRYASHNIDIAPALSSWLARGCFMYNVNHPKPFVLLDLAIIACRMLGLPVEPGSSGSSETKDPFAHLATHPVYPDFAAMIGVPPEITFREQARPGCTPPILHPGEFLERSFAVYAGLPRDALLRADGVGTALGRLNLLP